MRFAVVLLVLISCLGVQCTGREGTAEVVNYAADGYDPPPVLDVAYLDAVVAAIGSAEQEAYADAARRGALGDELEAELTALMGPLRAEGQVRSLQQMGGAEVLRTEPGGRLYRVLAIRSEAGDCVIAEGKIDPGSVVEGANDAVAARFLLRLEGERHGGNPTPWLLTEVERPGLGGDPGQTQLSCDS